MTCSNTSFCISGVERCSEGMCSVGFLGGDDTTAPTSSGGESSSWGWVWLSRMLVGVVSAMCAGITYWDSCLIPDASGSVVFGLVDSWILTSSSSKTFSKSALLSWATSFSSLESESELRWNLCLLCTAQTRAECGGQCLGQACPNYSTKGRVAAGFCSNQSRAHGLTNELSEDWDQLIKWVRSGVLWSAGVAAAPLKQVSIALT